MIRALIRLSKDELLSNSPETQRNLHLMRAKTLNIPESQIVWYEDLGVSGYSEGDETKRGQFSGMLEEVQPGDEVWAVDTSRFARDIRVAQKTVQDLQHHGVRVVFFDLPLDLSKRTQRTTAGFKQLSDQLFRDVISEKTEQAVPTVRAKNIRWGRWPTLFEVVEEDGHKVVRPSKQAMEVLSVAGEYKSEVDANTGKVRGRLTGRPHKAVRKFGINYMQVLRLAKAYAEWQRTKPWYTSKRYDERREEYAEIKRIKRDRAEALRARLN